MDFMQEYEKWLHSPALSQEEHAELESIQRRSQGDREPVLWPLWSSAPPASGALMGVGLQQHEHPCDPPRHPGLCRGHPGRGARRPPAQGRGHLLSTAAIHSQEFAQAAAGVMAANGIPVPHFRVPAAHPGAVLCRAGVRLHRRASTSPPATTPRSTTATRSTGRTGPSFPPTTPPPSPSRWRSSTCLTACSVHGL